MSDLLLLIERSRRSKKESVSATIRMPESTHAYIETLASDLELSKQELMLKLLEHGKEAAQQAVESLEKADLLQLALDEEAALVEEIEQRPAAGFHILNTNKAHTDLDHDWMLTNKAAAAFYEPWKRNINRIKKDEVVFLYENGKGIVAYGRASGEVRIRDHEGEKDECHYQILEGFKILEHAISAAAIKKALDRNVVFLRTMSGMPDGQKILDLIDPE